MWVSELIKLRIGIIDCERFIDLPSVNAMELLFYYYYFRSENFFELD